MLDYCVISEVEELLASGQSHRRIASTVGISKESVRRIADGVHPLQLSPQPCDEDSIPCPHCGDIASEGVDLHGAEWYRYLAMRGKVEKEILMGHRSAMSDFVECQYLPPRLVVQGG